MIACARCGKENQEHYKFCLGCGTELPRAAKKDAPARPHTSADLAPPAAADPVRFDRNMQLAATQQQSDTALAARAGASATGATRSALPQVAPGAAPVTGAPAISAPAPRASAGGPPVHRCPACSNPVPADFKFCGTCGHRITSGNDGATAGAAPASGPAAPPTGLAATSPAGSAAATATGPQRGVLVLINPDGSEGVSFPLMEGATPVGRTAGKLFSSDAYLSPLHATFTVKGDVCTVRDENSLNGVYVKLARDRSVRLANGDIFRIGQEILRFETMPPPKTIDGVELMGSVNPGFIGRICLVIGRDSIGHAHTIPREGIYLGRERGDVIFPEDGYVSGLHCRIQQDADSMALTDIGSSNGTFLRVRGERRVASGELILMGQQLFRLQLQ